MRYPVVSHRNPIRPIRGNVKLIFFFFLYMICTAGTELVPVEHQLQMSNYFPFEKGILLS